MICAHLLSGVLLLAATCATAGWIAHAGDPSRVPHVNSTREDPARGARAMRPRPPETPQGRLAAAAILTALSTGSTLLHPCWIQPFLVLALASVVAALGCAFDGVPHRRTPAARRR